MGIALREVAFGSDEYAQMCAFRDIHLRRPLGLTLSHDDVRGEDKQFHIAAIQDGGIIGTVVLKPASPVLLTLRQMAVDPNLRGSGLGRSIVSFAEKLASDRGFSEIEMAARITAEGFYERLGYHRFGDVFVEVTIPHVHMKKRVL